MSTRDRWGVGLLLMAIVMRLDADLLGLALAAAGFVALTWARGDR